MVAINCSNSAQSEHCGTYTLYIQLATNQRHMYTSTAHQQMASLKACTPAEEYVVWLLELILSSSRLATTGKTGFPFFH